MQKYTSRTAVMKYLCTTASCDCPSPEIKVKPYGTILFNAHNIIMDTIHPCIRKIRSVWVYVNQLFVIYACTLQYTCSNRVIFDRLRKFRAFNGCAVYQKFKRPVDDRRPGWL